MNIIIVVVFHVVIDINIIKIQIINIILIKTIIKINNQINNKIKII